MLQPEHFALLRPDNRQVLVDHLFKIETARLAPGEDRLLDVGREESEPQQAGLIARRRRSRDYRLASLVSFNHRVRLAQSSDQRAVMICCVGLVLSKQMHRLSQSA